LPTGDERRLSLAPDLCFALWGSGRFEEAQEVLAEASTASDPVVSAIAAILETGLENLERHGVTLEAKQARRERARVILEEASDEEGLSLYWWSLGQDAFFRCRAAECMEAAERSIAHAEAAGIARLVWKSAGLVRGCLVWGSMPVGEAIERAMDPRLSSFGQVGEAAVSLRIGLLTAMRGDVGGGRALVQGARRTLRDAGLFMVAEGGSMYEADIAWRAGDTETWEHLLRDGLGRLRELGAHTHAATVALNLADCLFVRGRLSEIDSLCSWARDRTDADDVVNAVFLGGLEGLVLAGRGHLDDAERSARRAVELGDTTDFFDSRAWPRIVLAETLAFGGRMDEAAELHALLQGAGIDPPYVLVGHSFGGFVSRLFATAYPQETAGLLLIESSHEDEIVPYRHFYVANPRDAKWFDGGNLLDIDATAVELRGPGHDLGDLPLIVLRAQRYEDVLTVALWKRTQADLATISTDSILAEALDSGHFVIDENRQAVLEAVAGLVDAARAGAPLAVCEQIFTPSDVKCLVAVIPANP